jgi:hypothetical protein
VFSEVKCRLAQLCQTLVSIDCSRGLRSSLCSNLRGRIGSSSLGNRWRSAGLGIGWAPGIMLSRIMRRRSKGY